MASTGIPNFNLSGVLPPYTGADPSDLTGMSPYATTVDGLVMRFNTSPDRQAILRGFLQLRQVLRGFGFVGWQWLDGSFLENIEQLQGRAPGDIDIVTFSFRPASVQSQVDWANFVNQNQHVFDPSQAKANFRCDAYFVELDHGPRSVVSLTRYWFGLFSHQRQTEIWKGMLEVELTAQDGDASARSALGI